MAELAFSGESSCASGCGSPCLQVCSCSRRIFWRTTKVEAASTFVLQYDSTVPLEARPAIQAAADTWASLLTSPLQIYIAVSFYPYNPPPTPYPPRLTLGGPAGGVTINDFFGAPLSATEYPEALAKALTGHEFYPVPSSCSFRSIAISTGTWD